MPHCGMRRSRWRNLFRRNSLFSILRADCEVQSANFFFLLVQERAIRKPHSSLYVDSETSLLSVICPHWSACPRVTVFLLFGLSFGISGVFRHAVGEVAEQFLLQAGKDRFQIVKAERRLGIQRSRLAVDNHKFSTGR